MKITSMSNKELYRTLMGRDLFPNKSNGAAEPKKATTIDLSNALAASKQENTIQVDEEVIAKARKFDRFETSLSYRSYEIGKTPIADEDLAVWENDIDFNDKYTRSVINSKGIIARDNGGRGADKESIAKYYGEIAKRLDAAYAEGKFTKEEYDYINEGIAKEMEHTTQCAEKAAAFFKAGRERYNSIKAYEREATMTPEDIRADREATILDYVNRFCKIDRKALMQLFNSTRYGK